MVMILRRKGTYGNDIEEKKELMVIILRKKRNLW